MITTVTSAYMGEGKSTIIKQKAEEAVIDKKVIVIDLDIYYPVLADRFGVKADKGIVEYIDGQELNIMDVNGIKFIPCLKSNKSFKEIVENPKFIELLKELSSEYDEIYIDAPPVCICHDIKKFFDLCEGIIVVIKKKRNVAADILMKNILKGYNIIETIDNRDKPSI